MSERCPGCGVSSALEFCANCGAPRVGRVAPSHLIPMGEHLVSYDLAEVPPPGQRSRDGAMGSSSWEPAMDGIDLSVPAGRTLFLSDSDLRMREAVARLQFTALDEFAAAGCIARQELIGDGEVDLFFEVNPGRARARLCRRFNIGTSAQVKELVSWTESTLIPGVGQRMEVDFRVRGSLLQGWVNGQCVLSTTDPVLSTGRSGIRASAPGGDARFRAHHFSVWRAGSGT